MKNYQLILVLKSSLSEASRKKALDNIKSFLKDAKFSKDEAWGQKALSYVIRHESSGFYHNFLFELKADIEKDFIKKLHANDDVLRHLLLRRS